MNSLVPDYDSSSEEEQPNEDVQEAELPIKLPCALPLPQICVGPSGQLAISQSTSIFTNPFEEARYKDISVLEKHVKMVPEARTMRSINGRKVCWKYRNGKCRLGAKCKFAHDNEVLLPSDSNSAITDNENGKTLKNVIREPTMSEELHSELDGEVPDTKRRKSKFPMPQGLVPSKKSRNAFSRVYGTKKV